MRLPGWALAVAHDRVVEPQLDGLLEFVRRRRQLPLLGGQIVLQGGDGDDGDAPLTQDGLLDRLAGDGIDLIFPFDAPGGRVALEQHGSASADFADLLLEVFVNGLAHHGLNDQDVLLGLRKGG